VAENIKAGSLYFIMTHIGTAFIIFAFLLIYWATGSFDFDAIEKGMADAAPSLRIPCLCLRSSASCEGRHNTVPYLAPRAHPRRLRTSPHLCRVS